MENELRNKDLINVDGVNELSPMIEKEEGVKIEEAISMTTTVVGETTATSVNVEEGEEKKEEETPLISSIETPLVESNTETVRENKEVGTFLIFIFSKTILIKEITQKKILDELRKF